MKLYVLLSLMGKNLLKWYHSRSLVDVNTLNQRKARAHDSTDPHTVSIQVKPSLRCHCSIADRDLDIAPDAGT